LSLIPLQSSETSKVVAGFVSEIPLYEEGFTIPNVLPYPDYVPSKE